MPTLIDLPGGGKAELHDKLTVRGRRILAPAFADMLKAMVERFPNYHDFAQIDLTDTQLAVELLGAADGHFVAMSMDFQAAAIVAFVKSWTLGPPPTVESVWQIDNEEVFDTLAEATAPLAVGAMRRTEFGPAGAKDPDSPTVPSPGLEPGGRADPTTTTPSTSPTATLSTESENGNTGVCFT